jgi:integrase
MARLTNRLSARFVQTAKPRMHPYPDGGNLYLDVTTSKAGGVNKSWLLIYEVPGSGSKAEGIRGKRRSMGLGPYPDVSTVAAREEAKQCRDLLRKGIDPLDHRRQERQANIKASAGRVLFRDEAAAYIALHAKGWTPRFADDWKSTLKQHAYPKLGALAVNEITSADVMGAVEPIWTTRTVTAGRVLNRIERVLDYAAANGHRQGDNPAAHIREALPKATKIAPVQNLKAIGYGDVPALMVRLAKDEDTVATRALRFLILCASRSGEVMGAHWNEIDEKQRLWIIPASRMKAGQRHRVPLSDEALALLTSPLPAQRPKGFLPKGWKPGPVPVIRSGRIFNIDPHGLRRVLVRLGIDTTVHGFRSCFRQWAGERTGFARNPIELCLAHKVAMDQSEDAYLRDMDLIEPRRKLMQQWATFCTTPVSAETADNVHNLRRA